MALPVIEKPLVPAANVVSPVVSSNASAFPGYRYYYKQGNKVIRSLQELDDRQS